VYVASSSTVKHLSDSSQLRSRYLKPSTDYQLRWEVLPPFSEKVCAGPLVLRSLADTAPVLSIIASPTLSSDVRHRAMTLLRSVHSAYTTDRAARTVSTSSSTASATPEVGAKSLDAEIESGELDDKVENAPVRTGEILRVHRIYMDRRREFEVRVGKEGKMELWDAKEGKMWI